MEVLVGYEKILNYFNSIEINEYSTLFSKYYVRYEFDNNNLTDVEAKMSNHEICFSTKINKKEDIKILMHIFEHLMYILDILQKFKSGDYPRYKFSDLISQVFLNPDNLDSLIFNVISSKKVELINIFKKYGIKDVSQKLYHETIEDINKLSNMFIYGSTKELISILNESSFYDGFSEIKHRHIKKEIKHNQIKIHHIHHLLKLIDKIKIFVWKYDLTDILFKNKDESLYKNIIYYLPNDVIFKKKSYFNELIKKSWHPNRVMDWCLTIDEQKELC